MVSAYRTAEQRLSKQQVLCPACATRVAILPGDELRCQKCGLSEKLLREDVDLRSELSVVDSEEASHKELQAAARAFGHKGTFAKLTLRCDGHDVIVGLDIDSGVVRGLDYSFTSAGLPNVRFRPELDDDVDAKGSGLSREVQTGDKAFDRAVYIESEAPDQHLLTMLASPAVRKAIRTLIERGETLHLSDGTARTYDRTRPECFSEERVRESASLLRVIAGAPRSLERVDPEPPSAARRASDLVFLFTPVGIALWIFGCQKYPALEYGSLGVTGIITGLVCAALLQPSLSRAVRGRSTSHRELIALRGVSFIGGVVLGIGTIITLNGVFDRSAQWVETGVVQSARWNDEDKVTNVTIRTPAREFETRMDDPRNTIRQGDTATVWLRKGLLDQAWKPQPVVVKSIAGAINED